MASERQSTLALDLRELDYLNTDAYLRAANSTSLRDFDYWHSRTTNNASYTENLIQEEYRRMYPSFDRVTQIHNSSTEEAAGFNGGTTQNLISNAVPDIDPQKESEFLILVQSIINRFDLYEENREDLFKVFGFMIVQAGLDSLHPDLIDHISYFKDIKFPNVSNLHTYCKSRSRADTARRIFKDIAAEYFWG